MNSRYNQRISIINFFFHHFLMKKTFSETKQFWSDKKKFDEWQEPIFKFIFNNFEKIIENIETNLDKNWKFNEISNFEKSILLVACGEFFSNTTPIEIVISEAVKTTKIYSQIENYKYINSVLDKVFNKNSTKLI